MLVPTIAVGEAAPPTRRVQFTPSTLDIAADALGVTPSDPTALADAFASALAVATEPTMKYKEQLRQTFPHGLPTLNLEPRTTNQLVPFSDLGRNRDFEHRVLGPLPIGTSASLVSTPIPHLCASRVVFRLCFYRVLLVLPFSVCVFVLL